VICGESLLNVKRVLYFDPKLSFEVLVDVTNIQLSYILIIKGTRCSNFLNVFFFGIERYMFRTGFLSIVRSVVLCDIYPVLCIQY
jgi:hypothetical protein